MCFNKNEVRSKSDENPIYLKEKSFFDGNSV